MYNWKQAFRQKNFRVKFFLSFIVLGLLLTWIGTFFTYVEARQGHIFYDPILNFFRPKDVSDFIFYTTYGSAVIGLIYAFQSPYYTLHFCQMYVLLTLFRIVCMFVIPLDPPAGIIPLKDPILQKTVYEGFLNLKDLFFSGHTATLFLFFFFVKNDWLKLYFFIAAVSVAFGLVIQHVHYSADIIAAPVFAFLSWKIVMKLFKHYHKAVTT
jgi:hypothetical protein